MSVPLEVELLLADLEVQAESDLITRTSAPQVLQLVAAYRELTGVQCSNPRHPRGPWHAAASIPGSWEWAERFIQWLRRRRYGCGCQP